MDERRQDQDWMTTAEAAEALGVSNDCLRWWRYVGRGGPPWRKDENNGRCYYRREDIENLYRLRQAATDGRDET